MRRRDSHTTDLFDWAPDAGVVGYGDDVAGRGAINNRIARLIGRALRDAKDAGASRADISRKMAVYLERPIASGSLDKWAAEGTTDRCIPLDAFAALIHAVHEATGRYELIGLVPSLFGYAAVPQHHVELIEIQQIEEHEADMAARKAALKAKAKARSRR